MGGLTSVDDERMIASTHPPDPVPALPVERALAILTDTYGPALSALIHKHLQAGGSVLVDYETLVLIPPDAEGEGVDTGGRLST